MKMVNSILPYANGVMEKIPSYGRFHALVFVSNLLLETTLRFSKKPEKNLLWISLMKVSPLILCAASAPLLRSWKILIPGFFLSSLFLPNSLSIIGSRSAQWLTVNKSGIFPKHIQAVTVEADRPPLISFVACTVEALNIASKVFNSIGAGVVAQKMFNGQTEGKVRVAVTGALLALSALNIYKAVYRKLPEARLLAVVEHKPSEEISAPSVQRKRARVSELNKED
jgi:hypothetical protein